MKTDAEIVRALKEVLEIMCVLGDLQKASTISKAIDLINRLQEKNSNLTSDLSSLQNDLTSLQAENERFGKIKKMLDMFWEALLKIGMAKRKEKPTLEEFAEALQEIQASAKAEAYKEFAERLKEKITEEYNYFEEQEYPRARISDIDNLLKELVGDIDV